MKSTKDGHKKPAPASAGKQTIDSKPAAGKEEEAQLSKTQGPGTTGRRKPPPPENGILKPDES